MLFPIKGFNDNNLSTLTLAEFNIVIFYVKAFLQGKNKKDYPSRLQICTTTREDYYHGNIPLKIAIVNAIYNENFKFKGYKLKNKVRI